MPWVAASALVLILSGCGGHTGSTHGVTGGVAASCIAPYLDDQPPGGPFEASEPTVAPGGTLTLYGHWYTSTCNDTGSQAPMEPLPPVHVTLRLPGGAVQDLGEFHPAGDDLGFSLRLQVPGDTPAGEAKVHDDRETPATFAFRVGGS